VNYLCTKLFYLNFSFIDKMLDHQLSQLGAW
jgi:hypothetical protein